MKRTIVFVALLASIMGGMRAQDTLWQRPAPLDNYFSNNWIDTSNHYATSPGMWVGCSQVCARQFVTTDTMQIYGIAAMMVDLYFLTRNRGDTILYSIQDQLDHSYPEDPTLDNLEESLLLFQYHGPDSSAVMQQLGDSLPVHYLQTQPTYYMMSYRQPLASYTDTFPKPVYERYFAEPQTVHDTFFAGFTQNHWRYNKEEEHWYDYRASFAALAFDHSCQGALDLTYEDEAAYLLQEKPDSSRYWFFSHQHNLAAFFIFPILTPDTNGGGSCDTTTTGDTTVVDPGDTIVSGSDTVAMGDTLVVTDTLVIGGDTIVTCDTLLAVVQADMLARLTGVMPNPASTTAKVVSSFGLTRIEVYSSTGAKVYDRPASGLAATLDVSRWPSGTYLLRIHTPMGVATKRFAVAR